VDSAIEFHDYAPEQQHFLAEVLACLGAPPRSIPSKYLYDAAGSALFDRICELDEYYLTRTEAAILRTHGEAMLSELGADSLLIEYGSGSSLKTRILLDQARDLRAYVPVDISKEHLLQSARALEVRYPDLEIVPVCADYTSDYELPKFDPPERRRVVYFPGSTIGNLTPDDAVAFLAHARVVAGSGGGLLIGVDLHKDAATIEAAYDDAEGISAEFAFNVLDRMNRELDANFAREAFRYRARYDPDAPRVEMALVSRRAQRVQVGGSEIRLASDEAIRTEWSCKYTLAGFAALAERARLEVRTVWTDEDDRFSVQYLAVA